MFNGALFVADTAVEVEVACILSLSLMTASDI